MTWEKNITCKFCQHKFYAVELNVRYEDLRSPEFFNPDYQYFIVCPLCDGKLIQSTIPSDIALRIQEKYAESNDSPTTK